MILIEFNYMILNFIQIGLKIKINCVYTILMNYYVIY